MHGVGIFFEDMIGAMSVFQRGTSDGWMWGPVSRGSYLESIKCDGPRSSLGEGRFPKFLKQGAMGFKRKGHKKLATSSF